MRKTPAECGTTGGYVRHRRRHEQPCDACLAAKRTYVREKRANDAMGTRKCPMCLVGACHGCTGRLTVLNAAGTPRDERCEHKHPRPTPVEPAGVPMLADIPIRSTR